MERKKKKAAVVCCSNAVAPGQKEQLKRLEQCLQELGVEPVWSDHIYAAENGLSGSAQQKAEALQRFYGQEDVEHIFDISGGDLANEILPFLDYEEIARSEKTFWGYSDLTCVINAIYSKCGKASVLYQVRNLLDPEQQDKREWFADFLMEGSTELFGISYEFLQGTKMSGILVGGNIRCLLKLAGTPYWPDMKGKILVLEAYSGNAARIAAYFNQLKQMGVFEQVNGVLLGTFTEMERNFGMAYVQEIFRELAGERLPIAMTKEIGHGRDAKAIVIGKMLRLGMEEEFFGNQD